MGHSSVDDVEQGHDHSESYEKEWSYDEYESDLDTSDCSVTLPLEGDHLQEASALSSHTPIADAMILQEDESIDTTWTDDKHSSYLDSIETTFVRKMYDKEYCSMDVCGHSSHSSITLEQDCVESHPFYLNTRKPHEQAIGLLPFRGLSRPWSSTSTVLASPWIQHFKTKQVALAKKCEAQENGTKMEQTNLLLSKKRGTLLSTPECKQLAINSYITTAGGFKKLKCKQALSHMDMVMEEQYNTDQQNQNNADQYNPDKLQSDGTEEEEVKMQPTGVLEISKARKSKEVPETSFFNEKQANAMCIGIGPTTTMLAKELLVTNSIQEQAVLTFKDGDKEACEQSVVTDKAMPSKQEHDLYIPSGETGAYVEQLPSHSTEHEKESPGSGSKTWTWGTQGVRYRLGGTMSSVNCKF
eukprot:c25052_g1_i1 orf=320-1558(-)